MKKLLFKRAWELFKRYNLSFSQALTKAWNDFKRSILVMAFERIPSKTQYAKKKLQAKQMYRNFPEVAFSCVPRNIVNNSGASFYYDGKTFNAD